MARIPDLKRIVKENFKKEDQALIDQLAFPINAFFEQTRSALDKRLDFTNINQELITLTVTVDSGGIPVTTTKYKSGLRTNVAGNTVIYALNNTSTSVFPTAAPFLTFVQSGDIIQILQVAGLPANNEFKLTILSIGK